MMPGHNPCTRYGSNTNSDPTEDLHVNSGAIEEAGNELEADVCERFDVDQDDVEITAEQETVGGRDIVTLRARWMA